MPAPKVTFTRDISADDRQKALDQMQNWTNSQEVSARKKWILQPVIDYAKKHLINWGILNFTDPSRIDTCAAIFAQADLPDIYFMQFVINQLSNIQHARSGIRDEVLPKAIAERKKLLLPYIRQNELASIGLSVGIAMLAREPALMILAVAGLVAREELAILRLSRALENRLASVELNGQIAPLPLGDGLDDGLNALANLGRRAGTSAISFFNRLLPSNPPPALAEGSDKGRFLTP